MTGNWTHKQGLPSAGQQAVTEAAGSRQFATVTRKRTGSSLFSLLSTRVFRCAITNPLPTHGSPFTPPCIGHWDTKNKSRFLLWKDDDEARFPNFWKA